MLQVGGWHISRQQLTPLAVGGSVRAMACPLVKVEIMGNTLRPFTTREEILHGPSKLDHTSPHLALPG